jgi:uncharacterized membrane protein YhaH (DUF805 family)
VNIWTIVGIAFFLASVVLSQRIAVDAGSKLDDSTKLKLAEVFPRRNVNYTIIVFSIVIVFLLALYLVPEYFRVITFCYGIVFLIYILLKLYLNVRKLKEIGAPASYVRSIVISFAVFIGGAIAAAIVIAIGLR